MSSSPREKNKKKNPASSASSFFGSLFDGVNVLAQRSPPGISLLQWPNLTQSLDCMPQGIVTNGTDHVWMSCLGGFIAHGLLHRNNHGVIIGLNLHQFNYQALDGPNELYAQQQEQQARMGGRNDNDEDDPPRPYQIFGDGDYVRLLEGPRRYDGGSSGHRHHFPHRRPHYRRYNRPTYEPRHQVWFGLESSHLPRTLPAALVRYDAESLEFLDWHLHPTHTTMPWIAFEECHQLALTYNWSHSGAELSVFDAHTMTWRTEHNCTITNLADEYQPQWQPQLQDHAMKHNMYKIGNNLHPYLDDSPTKDDDDDLDNTGDSTSAAEEEGIGIPFIQGAAVDNSIHHVKNRQRQKPGLLYLQVDDYRSTLLALQFDDLHDDNENENDDVVDARNASSSASSSSSSSSFIPGTSARIVEVWHSGLGNQRFGLALTAQQILSIGGPRDRRPRQHPRSNYYDASQIVALDFPSALSDSEVQFGWGMLSGLVIAILLQCLVTSCRRILREDIERYQFAAVSRSSTTTNKTRQDPVQQPHDDDDNYNYNDEDNNEDQPLRKQSPPQHFDYEPKTTTYATPWVRPTSRTTAASPRYTSLETNQAALDEDEQLQPQQLQPLPPKHYLLESTMAGVTLPPPPPSRSSFSNTLTRRSVAVEPPLLELTHPTTPGTILASHYNKQEVVAWEKGDRRVGEAATSTNTTVSNARRTMACPTSTTTMASTGGIRSNTDYRMAPSLSSSLRFS